MFFFKKKQPEQVEESKSWNVLTQDDTLNKPKEVVKDKIISNSRRIGKIITSDIAINQTPNMDLSVKDQLSLARHYDKQRKSAIKKREEDQAINDSEATMLVALRTFIYRNLSQYLTEEDDIVELQIDTKFIPYLPTILEEVAPSYVYQEIKINEDIYKLDNTLPICYEFSIRPLNRRL